MRDIQSLSDEELLALEGGAKATPKSRDISSLSDEELLSLGQVQPMQGPQMAPQQALPSRPGYTPELPTTGAQEGEGVMPYIAALLSGGKRGLGELGSGAARMAAQGVDKLAGTSLQQQVPQYQLSGIDKEIAKAYPTTANIGEFAAKAAPMFLAPEFGGGLMGQMAGQAAVGGLEGAIESPEDRLAGMLTGTASGAAGPVIGKGAGYIAGAGRKGAQKALKGLIGGTSSGKEIETGLRALSNIGVEDKMPIGHLTNAPHAKSASSLMAYIPGSRQARDMIDIGKGIEKKVSGVMDEIKPTTKESLATTSRGFIDDVKKGAKKESAIANSKFENLEKSAEAAGVNFNKDSLYKSAENVSREIVGTDLEKDTHLKKIISRINKTESSPIYGTRLKRTESFGEALKLRRDLNQALRDTPFDQARKKRLLMSLKDAVDTDLISSAEKSGNNEIVGLLRDANKYYIDNVMPLNTKEVTKFTKLGADPDQFMQTFMKTGKYDRDVLLDKVVDHLSPENKGKFAHRFLNKSAKEALGEEKSNPGRILNEYMGMSENAKNKLFTPKQKELMDSAHIVKEMAGGDLHQLVNPKTGNVWVKLAGMLGAATIAPPVAANLAVRLLKSQKLRDQYIKAAESGKIQPVEKIIKQAAKLTSPAYMGLQFLGNNGNK
jgi:hypothetical protein